MSLSSYKPEKWSASLEQSIAQKTKDATIGAPHQVAWFGEVITVTRRCAREMFRRGMITGCRSVRGGTSSKEVRADVAKQRAQAGGTIDITVRPSGDDGVWIISSKAMNYEAPSKNPAKDMMLLTNEWWEIIDHGTGSFAAECAGDWRIATPA